MHRGECAEGHRCRGEGSRIHVEAEDGVDAREARRAPWHAVRGRREPALILVPRRGTGEEQLDGDARDVHPAERPGKDGGCARGSEEEKPGGDEGGEREVEDAVREPGEKVQNGVGVGGEDIGEVRAIEDVFESRKDADPNVRTDISGNEPGESSQNTVVEGTTGHEKNIPTAKEVEEIHPYREPRPEDLPRHGHKPQK